VNAAGIRAASPNQAARPGRPAAGSAGGEPGGAGRGLTLRSAVFRKGREQGWRRLDDMIRRVEKSGLSALSADEAQELPLLYLAAMSSLSVARNIALDRNLLLYLENLSLRAYLAVYGPRVNLLAALYDFFRRGFPRAVRGLGRHLAIVGAAFLSGGAAGYLLVSSNMEYFSLLTPESLAGPRGPASTAEELRAVLFAPWPGFIDTFVVFANSLFRHNAVIGIFSFGLGFALGLPTILLMIYNGLIIGAFIALHADKGLAVDFIGWLSIHGATEITAILLCGAAGLAVAEKVMFPDRFSRLESLARHGRQAAGVVAGAVVLFFIAGFLEGGFRQLINNTPARFAFALATGAAWLYYFLVVGKAGPHGDDD
jgi:uncharacterized membrane protein SpoIIM required for sporulation